VQAKAATGRVRVSANAGVWVKGVVSVARTGRVSIEAEENLTVEEEEDELLMMLA